MSQKVIIMFWWEPGLLSASRNHATIFCRPFVHYAYLRLYSAIVHVIQNNCFICKLRLISAYADHIGYVTNFCSMIKLLHTSSKTAVVYTEAFRQFDNAPAGKKKN